MGIFRHESVGSTVSGPCSCGGSLCVRGAALTARHLFTERALERGSLAWRASTTGRRAYSGSARAVREAYMNPLISPSLQSFYSPVLQRAENSLNTSNYFHALEMATFDPISYTYVPTVPRFKSAVARPKPAPKQVSFSDEIQRAKPSSTSLSTPRPPAATDNDRSGRSGIRETGMSLFIFCHAPEDFRGGFWLTRPGGEVIYTRDNSTALSLTAFPFLYIISRSIGGFFWFRGFGFN